MAKVSLVTTALTTSLIVLGLTFALPAGATRAPQAISIPSIGVNATIGASLGEGPVFWPQVAAPVKEPRSRSQDTTSLPSAGSTATAPSTTSTSSAAATASPSRGTTPATPTPSPGSGSSPPPTCTSPT
jgi:hypothetical protein